MLFRLSIVIYLMCLYAAYRFMKDFKPEDDRKVTFFEFTLVMGWLSFFLLSQLYIIATVLLWFGVRF